MGRNFALLAASALIAQPVMAADSPSKAERDRQLSEIVFQNYPPRALAAGEEGPVFFTVTLDKDAAPISCQVTHGSGHPLLDEETCDLIVQHAVFKSARDANGRLTHETAEGVVNWTIPGHQPQPINLAPQAAKNLPEKQVCKKTVRTGTISGVERTCMTAAQWANQSDEQKRTYAELQGRRGFTSDVMCQGDPCDTTLGRADFARQAANNPPPR